MTSHLEERLVRIVRETSWMVDVLGAVRELALPDWCVGGGVIRNLVWDNLHGYAEPSWPGDVDVAYFDAANTSRERDVLEEQRLGRVLPDIRWDVKNQAGIHEWFRSALATRSHRYLRPMKLSRRGLKPPRR